MATPPANMGGEGGDPVVEAIVATAARMQAWWTPHRFRIAYELALRELRRQGVPDPAYRLALAIGRTTQTLSAWRVGNWKPDPLSMYRIDKIFTTILGQEWMDRVLEIDLKREVIG